MQMHILLMNWYNMQTNTYNLIETNSTERKYIEQQKNLKESLILQHKPEVLGEMKDIPKPDISNEESVREYFCKIKR